MIKFTIDTKKIKVRKSAPGVKPVQTHKKKKGKGSFKRKPKNQKQNEYST